MAEKEKKEENSNQIRLNTLIENGKYLHDLDQDIFDRVKPGEKITTIAAHFDQKMRKDGYRAMPISIELDGFCGYMSPIEQTVIENDHKVSWSVTIFSKKGDNFKCPISIANTKSLHNSIIMDTINNASKKVIKASKPGIKMVDLSKIIIETLKEGEIKTVLNQYSALTANINNQVPMKDVEKKLIPLSETPHDYNLIKYIKDKSMRPGEVYYIDIYGTNLHVNDVARVFEPYPTMLKINKTNQKNSRNTKNKKVNQLFNEMLKEYGEEKIFSIRNYTKVYESKNKNRHFDIDLIKDLVENGSVDIIPAQFVEYDWIAKKEKALSLKEKEKKEGKSESITTELKKLSQSDTIVFHIGRTILIENDGARILC